MVHDRVRHNNLHGSRRLWRERPGGDHRPCRDGRRPVQGTPDLGQPAPPSPCSRRRGQAACRLPFIDTGVCLCLVSLEHRPCCRLERRADATWRTRLAWPPRSHSPALHREQPLGPDRAAAGRSGRLWAGVAGHAVGVAANGRFLRPPRSAMADILRLHTQACRLARTRPDILTHREVAHARAGLIHALVNGLAGRRLATVQPRASDTPRSWPGSRMSWHRKATGNCRCPSSRQRSACRNARCACAAPSSGHESDGLSPPAATKSGGAPLCCAAIRGPRPSPRLRGSMASPSLGASRQPTGRCRRSSLGHAAKPPFNRRGSILPLARHRIGGRETVQREGMNWLAIADNQPPAL